MYKRKLIYFGLTTGFTVFLLLISLAICAQISRESFLQSHIAHSLLLEHKTLSNVSYRLFKQLTDEVIFDQHANQAKYRNKKSQINNAINTIRKLALEQRIALGEEITKGSIEDIDQLRKLIDLIITEFEVVITSNTTTPLNEQKQLHYLLESTIDNQFRELINTAVARQYRVVAAINSKINMLNMTVLWSTFGIGLLAIISITYACYWLFNQLYQPLIVIKNATTAIASDNYQQPIAEKLDDEFQEIASSVNQLALKLQEHEAAEASARRRLEFEVDQRTSELTKINLELTKIDARRRQFISDVSHEFRTPLTIIRGEAQVTLRLNSASQLDYKTTLESVLSQAVNLSRLVDDLLFLTRAEMNQLSLEKIPTDIEQLVESELIKWRRLYPHRKITLQSELNSIHTHLLIDPSRIRQVLSILIDNASKYSGVNQAIDVSLSDNTKFIYLKVQDYGGGISAAEIDNIFERFVRFSKDKEGLGLGLPIARAIVEAHGGNIQVTSDQTIGSVFIIALPRG